MRGHFERKAMHRGLTITLALTLVLALALLVGCGRGVGVKADSDTYTPDEFSSVDFELDIGEVIYHTGDQYLVTVERVNYPELEVQVANGTLTITETPDDPGLPGISTCKVEITVPADAELDSISLDVDAGSITATDVTASQVDFSVDAGSVTLDGVTADTVGLEVDAGSIAVAGFSGLQEANVSLQVDMGEVVYLGSGQGTSFSQAGQGATLTATVEAGEIEVRS